jgi:hypothetical protein
MKFKLHFRTTVDQWLKEEDDDGDTISIFGSRDSSVGIVTGYGLDGWGSFPGRGKIFLFYIASRPALGPTQPPIQWILGAVSPWVKRPGREADHSPPPSATVKNGRALPPLPHTSFWHSAQLIKLRNKFVLFFTFLSSMLIWTRVWLVRL